MKRQLKIIVSSEEIRRLVADYIEDETCVMVNPEDLEFVREPDGGSPCAMYEEDSA